MPNDLISQIAINNNYEHYRKDYIEVYGLIVENNDPLFQGRIKAKIFGYNEDISIDETSWISPNYGYVYAGKNGGGVFSYPKKDHIIKISGPDQYHLEYTVIIELNEKLVSMLKDSYENTQVLTYDEDEDLLIIWTKKYSVSTESQNDGGLLLWNKGSYVNISNNNNIHIHHKGGPSYIHLIDDLIHNYARDKHHIETSLSLITANERHQVDSWDVRLGNYASGSNFSATKCEMLKALLLGLAAIVDTKSFPPSPAATSLVNSMMDMICSNTVKIAF